MANPMRSTGEKERVTDSSRVENLFILSDNGEKDSA